MGPGKDTVCQTKRLLGRTSEGAADRRAAGAVFKCSSPLRPHGANFLKMSPSARKSYAGSWFFGARTDEGRQRRFQTIVERLNLNLNPMESMRKKQAADTAADAEEKIAALVSRLALWRLPWRCSCAAAKQQTERKTMQRNLTEGPIGKSLVLFSLPLIAGNLLQQLYNVADTLIVGKGRRSGCTCGGGPSYSLMVLLTSVILGLCMGSGVVFAQLYGAGRTDEMKCSIYNAFLFILGISAVINLAAFFLLEHFLSGCTFPRRRWSFTRQYLQIILPAWYSSQSTTFFASSSEAWGTLWRRLSFSLWPP